MKIVGDNEFVRGFVVQQETAYQVALVRYTGRKRWIEEKLIATFSEEELSDLRFEEGEKALDKLIRSYTNGKPYSVRKEVYEIFVEE